MRVEGEMRRVARRLSADWEDNYHSNIYYSPLCSQIQLLDSPFQRPEIEDSSLDGQGGDARAAGSQRLALLELQLEDGGILGLAMGRGEDCRVGAAEGQLEDEEIVGLQTETKELVAGLQETEDREAD
jgi:hypothetical protein